MVRSVFSSGLALFAFCCCCCSQTHAEFLDDDTEMEPEFDVPAVIDGVLIENCECEVCGEERICKPFCETQSNTAAGSGNGEDVRGDAFPGLNGQPESLFGVQKVRSVPEACYLRLRWERRVEEIITSTRGEQCVEAPPAPPPEAPYELVGNQDPDLLHKFPLTAQGGQAIVNQYCDAPPPMVERTAIAHCAMSHYIYKPLYYWVELEEQCSDNPQERSYAVRSVYLYGPPADRHRVPKAEDGVIRMWRDIPTDPADPINSAIWSYLRDVAHPQDVATATARMQSLYAMGSHIFWHELQHSRHNKRYLAALEQIFNSPRYPNTIVLGCTDHQSPTQIVLNHVRQERLADIRELREKWSQCSLDSFHAYENRADSYKTRLMQCACRGLRCHGEWPAPETEEWDDGVACDF